MDLGDAIIPTFGHALCQVLPFLNIFQGAHVIIQK